MLWAVSFYAFLELTARLRLTNSCVEDGYLLANEWPIYVFDALLMIIVLGICSLWYLGKIDSVTNEREDLEMVVGDREERGP